MRKEKIGEIPQSIKILPLKCKLFETGRTAWDNAAVCIVLALFCCPLLGTGCEGVGMWTGRNSRPSVPGFMSFWAFRLHCLPQLSMHRYVEDQICKDTWVTHSCWFSRELKQWNSSRHLNNIYSFTVKRNYFPLKNSISSGIYSNGSLQTLSPSDIRSVTKKLCISKGLLLCGLNALLQATGLWQHSTPACQHWTRDVPVEPLLATEVPLGACTNISKQK